MFDELLHVNIETCSDSKLHALIRQTLPVLEFHSQATRELLRRSNNNDQQATRDQTLGSGIIAIANGRKTSIQHISDINEEDFDVILDTTTNCLRYRKDPKKHTRLEESKREKVGSHRMKILAHMLKRPGTPFHAGNMGRDLVAGSDEVARNTFTKSVAVIRKALGQNDTSGPYIVGHFDCDGITGTRRGYFYDINPQWRYLLIRHGKNSGQIPL